LIGWGWRHAGRRRRMRRKVPDQKEREVEGWKEPARRIR
jgi:hypothetical protein